MIAVSGVAFHGACDPLISEVPREEDWPTPTRRRVGRGAQYLYEDRPGLAEQIALHLEQVGGSLMYGEPEDRAEGRVLLREAQRIRAGWRVAPSR